MIALALRLHLVTLHHMALMRCLIRPTFRDVRIATISDVQIPRLQEPPATDLPRHQLFATDSNLPGDSYVGKNHDELSISTLYSVPSRLLAFSIASPVASLYVSNDTHIQVYVAY